MADFKTHVTFSSCIGAGYAVVGAACGFDLATSLVAGGLCGVAGMLPDVDSDSGVPRRESLGFAAAIVPMLLIDRFKQFDLSHDQMVLLAAGLYFGIRFTLANLIGRWSVHRGMWHSIPAILIFTGIAFLISGPSDAEVFVRYFKAAAVGLGSFSHLLLDEIYSVDTRGVVPKFKKSFGSAIKFFGKKPMANFSVYGKLAIVIVAILMEPAVIERLELRNPELADRVKNAKDRLAHLPRPLQADEEGNEPEAETAPPSPTPLSVGNNQNQSQQATQSAPPNWQSQPSQPFVPARSYQQPNQQPFQQQYGQQQNRQQQYNQRPSNQQPSNQQWGQQGPSQPYNNQGYSNQPQNSGGGFLPNRTGQTAQPQYQQQPAGQYQQPLNQQQYGQPRY